MGLTVCGLIGSPFYRKICTLLDEKNIPFETESLNPFSSGEEFTALNPLRRIPVLKDSDEGEDFHLCDSSAIAHYIERKFPANSIMPASNTNYGKALWFEEYADTEMAQKIGLGVFRPVVFPQMSGKEPDFDSAQNTIREKLPAIHDYLEKQLDGQTWLVGDRFSLADISVGVQYGNLSFTGYSPSAERWPNLAAYMQRLGSKDSFAKYHIKAAMIFSEMKKLNMDPKENL